MERKLTRLVTDFQAGKLEGSIISTATVESLDQQEKQMWRAIRKEFEDIGIDVVAFDTNKTFIMGWFHQALNDGLFDENA